MVLNYYFDLPTGYFKEIENSNLYEEGLDENRGENLWIYIFYVLYHELKRKFPEIKINPINSQKVSNYSLGNSQKYSTQMIVIENEENKKYYVISFTDKLQLDPYLGWDLENCVGIFPLVGVHKDDIHFGINENLNYIPSTIITTTIPAYKEIEVQHALNNPKVIPKKLLFRGGCYHYREWIHHNDSRFDIRPERINGKDYIQEMAKYSIGIDINGVAEISPRTVDIMGLGMALIRPKLIIKYHNPLIPEYHYTAIKCEDQSNMKELTDGYMERLDYLKKHEDFRKFISENARKWYEENSTMKSFINIFLKLINIDKLK